MNALALAIALAAALCYALAAALQHRAARRERRHTTGDPRLLLRLLARPVWLAGISADLVGAGLHGAALAVGPLALVQPMLVSGLVMAVLIEAALDRRRPGRRDVTAVGLSAAGLAVFVAVVRPGPGEAEPADPALVDVVAAIGIGVAALLVVASRLDGPARATVLGVAAGALYGLAAALAKACVTRFTVDPLGLLADWRLYGLAVVGIFAMVLNQNAFQAGSLAGPLAGITLTDPLVSLGIAVTAYQETLLLGGVRSLIALVAVLAMGRGIQLASSVLSADRQRA